MDDSRKPGRESLLERAAEQLRARAGGTDSKKKEADKKTASSAEDARRRRQQRLIERAAEQLHAHGSPRAARKPAARPAGSGEAAPMAPAGAAAAAAAAAAEAAPAAKTAPARPAVKKRSRYQELDVDRLRRLGFITPDAGPSTTSEEFRIIKRPILLKAFAQGKHRIPNGNLVLVTSCRPGDGKTFCAINLALSIALEQDVRVLLVDADFPKPEALRTLGITATKGLMDAVLDSEVDLADCLIRTNVRNLTVLPAGRQHNLTPELLTSVRMGSLLNEIAQRYPDRIVIFDCAPVLASSVASALAMHTGQTAFVVEAERTTEQQIREALNMLTSCKHIGFILNKVRFLGPDRRFGAYYGYAYGR